VQGDHRQVDQGLCHPRSTPLVPLQPPHHPGDVLGRPNDICTKWESVMPGRRNAKGNRLADCKSAAKPRTLKNKIKAVLDRLSARNRMARESRSVADRYDYLTRVFRVSGQFEAHPRSARVARILGSKRAEVPERAWLIARILLRTSKDDRRLRSKHAAALTYAAIRGVRSTRLTAFIQEKGGFNECARRLRVRRRKGVS
jgi:hypothetical protein